MTTTSTLTADAADLAGRPVVVGAGLAGAIAALDLAPLPCVLVTGGDLGLDCASDWAQGGLAAAVGPDDDPELHAADTLAAGAGLCDEAVVRRITAAAPDVVRRLVDLGARFDRRPDGTLALGLEGAHSRHRIVHAAGDGSGHEITRAVVAAVLAADHIRVLTRTRATELVVADGRIAGVRLRRGDAEVTLPTDAVVLATGGAGALFAHTTNPRGSWGSGLALGLRAGATARDLEMVQFHPTALDVGADPMPLVSEAVRGEGAHLIDERGHRIIDDDLAPRDVVSRAVWAALERGRRVFLDTPTALGAAFATEFPTITAACAAAGLDPATQPLPVRPAAHYHMGGLLVDDRARTTVPGLWAVGEVASTGLHGANRLASNSLLEAVVTGGWAAADVRAARAGALFAGRPGDADDATRATTDGAARAANGVPPAPAPTVLWQGPTPEVRAVLERCCGVLRDEARLAEGVALLRPDAEHDDARLVALLIAWSAYRRTESRGAHRRTDHPRTAAPTHTTLTLADALADIDGRALFARSA